MNDFNKDDEKFVTDMIAHHGMAIDMATSYIAKAKNREINQWAIDILTGQMNEIMSKALWLKDRGLKVPDDANMTM